ncbi:MAG: heme ABC exporter ATP-binding protein CcmA [Anaerolineae bacterium]|nr:heme ABC exporter ATP-binding protein CcmA [Anaerolineae bacterium]
MQVAIEIRGLEKKFGSHAVLRGLDLSIACGRTVALVGANGAGKTTLLRLIAGLARPTAGAIWIHGLDTRSAREETRRQVGFLSHQPLLYLGLSAEENLRFYAALYGLDSPTERISALVTRVGLWPYLHEPVRTYSRGMRQRLAIARLLLHDPTVLLLDEPYTGLDEEGIATLHGLLSADDGQRTVLLTTHSLDRAARWADEAQRLKDGHLQALAPVLGEEGG